METIDGVSQWTSGQNKIFSPRKGQYIFTVTCQTDPIFLNPYNFRVCKSYDYGVTWTTIYRAPLKTSTNVILNLIGDPL